MTPLSESFLFCFDFLHLVGYHYSVPWLGQLGIQVSDWAQNANSKGCWLGGLMQSHRTSRVFPPQEDMGSLVFSDAVEVSL